MKTILSLIKVAIIFAIIAGCFFLLINKTFIYEIYKGELMEGDGIPISRFLYFLEEDNDLNVSFITPLSVNYLKEQKNNYLNNLTSCYGKYYYDEVNNITITKYSIIDNDYYRDVYISYVADNYCSSDYVLSDMWVYEYNALSTYVSGDITQNAMTKLIDKIYTSNRVENPNINTSGDNLKIKVTCKLNNLDYELEFIVLNENELLVTKNYNKEISFAVYEILNVNEYLNSLEKTTF